MNNDNKLTGEEIAKVFAMYLGCEVISQTPFYENEETSRGYITGVSIGEEELEVQFHNGIHAEESPDLRPFIDCKLNLTDLKDISEVDAVEALMLLGGDDDMIENFKKDAKGDYYKYIKLLVDTTMKTADNDVHPFFVHCVYEYLKNKSYAVPLFFAPGRWANGKTPLELNIAINKNSPTNDTK